MRELKEPSMRKTECGTREDGSSLKNGQVVMSMAGQNLQNRWHFWI
jgi:hypothetical protein